MTDEPQRRVLIAALVLLALVGLTAAAFASPVAADSHGNDSDAYMIEQGDQCVDVHPVVDESQSAEEFYDYRHLDSDPSSTTYSSYGTTAYQADNASTLMLYRGSEGTSLVIVHERLHDPAEQGTNGSSATFTVTGLSPEDDGWVVEDDDYDGQDDNFDHNGTTSEIDWVWAQGRTDGGVYRGLDDEIEIEIDPAFNEDADVRYVSSGYTGWVHDWEVVSATDDGHERVPLDSLEENVTIASGHCAAPPTASLDVDDAEPEVGESVTLDASGSESETGIDEYRWDLTGDGAADQTTEDPVLEHAVDEPGERNVTVTVVAEDGQTDAAVAAVDVGENTPPEAAIDAPAEAATGQTITLSAADSSDNYGIDSYAWAIENGPDASGETVQHAFDSPGEHEVALTVTDQFGNEGNATTTITVTEATGPAASLQSPDSATVGESVTLDASGSESETGLDEYRWDLTGDGAADQTTEDPVLEHAFDSPGEHEVALTVTDQFGNEGNATTTITVTEATGPAASLQSPDSATVGESVTLDASGSVAGENETYEWTVDGDIVAETSAPTHEMDFDAAGSHQVGVTVTDANGSDSETTAIEVAEKLNASVDATPSEAALQETIEFDASNSAGDVVAYDWAFDDDTTLENGGATVMHGFEDPGSYEVAVTVRDGTGATDTATVTVGVIEDAAGPDAQLDAPAEATVDEVVTLDASGIEAGPNATYVWVVEGTTEATTTNATYDHAFASTGDHEVSVSVTDANGTDEATTTVSVTEADDGDDDSGGGGYGGGGGGGYGPPPSEPDDPVETAVEVDDGAIVVTAENVEADEPFEVAIPANASVHAGADDRDVLALDSLEVTAAEDADTATITVEPAERSVPGRFSTVSAFEPDADIALESVTYDVGVDREAMATAGVSADELTAHARDDAWDPLETQARSEDGRIVATATVEGAAPVGIGAVGPVLYVSDVATDGTTVSGEAPLATTVENTGADPGEWTVPVDVAGETVAEQEVTLDPGEERTLATSVPAEGAADAGITVAGLRRELAVTSVTELSVTPTEPAPNETATIEATVVNRGDVAGEVTVELARESEVLATERVTLAPGEETTVAFEQSFANEGTVELAAGNATESIHVAERDSFEGEDSEVTSDATPGFGALAGLGALVALAAIGAVLVARRRE